MIYVNCSTQESNGWWSNTHVGLCNGYSLSGLVLHPTKLEAFAARQASLRTGYGNAFIYIPAVVLWEVSRHEQLGVVRLNEPYEDWVDSLLAHSCFDFVPLDEMVVIMEARKHTFNRDVFDAAIVATARLKDLPLITKDQDITESGVVEIYW
jgi:PIN domain nuclease of toxin-antitoxin system